MSNPFNKLKVQRDDEEDFVAVQSSKPAAATKQPLFGNPEDKAKKPKQRPKKETAEKEEENNEGFQFVGKQPKKPRTEETNAEVVVDKKFGKDNQKNDYPHKRGEGKVRVNTNQRVFDRHSGTGRGKEVKKEGAGGKYTWGNQGKNAQRDIVDYDDTDYYFNKALNPNVKKEEVVVEQKEEVKAEVKEEVVVAATEGEAKEEEGKDGKKDRKKKKGVETAEVDEKDKLVIPENAMTLEELKQKKAGAVKEEKVDKVEIKVDLEPIENKKVDVAVDSKKKGKKVKNDKVNPKEVDLNKLVKVNTEEEDSRGGRKNYNNNKKNNQNKFKFNDKDFPEL